MQHKCMDSQLLATWTKLRVAVLSLMGVSGTVLTVDCAVKGAVPVPGGEVRATRNRAHRPGAPRRPHTINCR